MDFCNDQNSFLVNFDLVKVETNKVNYEKMNCKRAEPNIEKAAGYLLEIYKDSKKVDKIVSRAAKDISDIYSLNRILKLMNRSIKKTKFTRQ